MNYQYHINHKGEIMKNREMSFDLPLGNFEQDKYKGKNIRWNDEGNHYELIFTDDFVTPSSHSMRQNGVVDGLLSLDTNSLLTDIILDMRKGDKTKEVHVFVGSFGGEVAALSMILQQLLCYEHRVGINLGTACSCGWMLLFACPERYVSPFSQTMYHDMSNLAFGKHSELRSNAEFMRLWQKELLHVTDTQKVLTEKELELGRTSEVWLTGRQLIERNAAKDYSEYLNRQIPSEEMSLPDGGLLKYSPFENGWIEYRRSKAKAILSYTDVLAKINSKPAVEITEEADYSEKNES